MLRKKKKAPKGRYIFGSGNSKYPPPTSSFCTLLFLPILLKTTHPSSHAVFLRLSESLDRYVGTHRGRGSLFFFSILDSFCPSILTPPSQRLVDFAHTLCSRMINLYRYHLSVKAASSLVNAQLGSLNNLLLSLIVQ